MKKTKKPNIANALRSPVLRVLAFIGGLQAAAHAFQLQDISLASNPAQASLRLSFAKAAGEGEYPLYFQKADPSRGTLTLSFLDTETPFPLGRHAVEPANPVVEEILLKRITSPSGKNFLGIELRLKDPPTGEAPVQPQPQGSLRIMLGKGGATRVAWSLAKSLKSREEYLTAKAEPAPAPPKGSAAAPAAPPVAAPSVKAEPAPKEPAAPPASETPATEPSSQAPEPSGDGSVTLKEIRMAVTRSQEDIALVFDPPTSTPVHTAQAGPADSTVLELTLDGVASALGRKEYALPRSGLFRRVRIASMNGNLVLRFQRVSADPVHILPQEGGLTLTGGGKGETAVPFKWTSLKPDAAPPQVADVSAEPVRSAHEEGAAVDAATGGGGRAPKGLSSSRVFSLGKGGKSMILLKDSAALKAAPGPKSKVNKKIPLGEKVERIERQGAWIKVVSGSDTGFIRGDQAAYEDEMTEAQVAALQKGMEAAAARIEAARKKAELLAAKQAAAAAAKEAAAQAKTAPNQPMAEAGPDAQVEEAEPVRVAGPAAAAPASKALPASALEAEPAAKGGPKLSMAENPELADKLAQEKKAAEDEKMRVEPVENRVAYNSYGRRDPFIPVEQGASENGIDIDQMKVVGIIWQAQEPMAVLEHNREAGISFTVKQGDPVHNGRVSRITRDQVTFDISEYGISRSYSLKLVSNKEGTKK